MLMVWVCHLPKCYKHPSYNPLYWGFFYILKLFFFTLYRYEV